MAIDSKKRERLVTEIIDLEMEMFLAVLNDEPDLCQEKQGSFRTMRDMSHCILSTETLMSYLVDLQAAKYEGRNLLRDKYARRKNIIPKLKTSEYIDEIIKIEGRWLRELSGKYPRTFKLGNPESKDSLSIELETYSDKTLKSYLDDVKSANDQDLNLAEMRYLRLFRALGYESISEIEEKVAV